jgi:OmcA/MtrC family decaheme c-type cytochrome
VSVDFKTMVHSIHAGGFRTQPLVIIGRGSSVNDFSDVRFPRELRDCTNCHIDAGGKGTFELPLRAGVLGTTVRTQSTYLASPRNIDVNPANDVRISPIAAVCSSCHDKTEVQSHMVGTGGASFATTQAAIGTTVRERCASCHGPGKEQDVRRAHEIRGTSGSASNDD